MADPTLSPDPVPENLTGEGALQSAASVSSSAGLTTLTAKDLSLSLLVIFIWGINVLMIKVGTEVLPSFLLTGLRFLLVAVLVVPFRPLPRAQVGRIVLVALVLGLGHFGLLFAAVARLGAATAAILLQLTVPFSAILAAVFYKERLGVLGWLGLVGAMCGIALVEGAPATSPDLFAVGMMLVSTFCWALSNVIVKKAGAIDPLTLNGWMAAFAAPMLLIVSAIVEHEQFHAMAQAGLRGWGAVFYTAVLATLIAYSLWYRLVARLSMNRLVPLTLLYPLIAVAGGGLFLGEDLTWMTLFGAAVTIVSVAVIQFRPKERRAV